MPNDDGPFVLDCDACDTSIGSFLSQVQAGEERVIAYAGRVLSKNELNYCVTTKELLAIVHFVQHFKQYLFGRSFTIRTDHSALTWLRKTPEPIGQNARWLEILGEYDFTIKHRPGSQHGNADSISRHPCLNRPSCTACHPAAVNSVKVVQLPHPEREENDYTSGVDQPLNFRGPADQATESIQSSSNFDGPADQTVNLRATADQNLTSAISVIEEDAQINWTGIEIMLEQLQDLDIGFIITLMSSHQEKPPWKEVEMQSSEVKTLWNEWDRLSLRNDVLCRKYESTDGLHVTWQIVLPHSLRKEFISVVHAGINGGHLGRSKTEAQLSQRVYWPGWTNDVRTELKKCAPCAQYHRGKAPKQTQLHPFTGGEPFEVIAIDITGKHPRSSRGNEYILTVIDLFSKWVEVFPLRNHTAPVVAKTLMDNFITRYGAPKRLISDQGPEFESELFQELCRRMEIDKIRTSPYKPTTNGSVERFHKTLNSMLAKVVAVNQKDWDERLNAVMAAYRASKHNSTGYTPNFLVFGHENRAPVDLILGKIVEEAEHVDSPDQFVCDMQEKYREAYALTRMNLEEVAQRRKSEYDIKVKPAEFEVGQNVWYYYPRRYTKRSPKWSKNYDGPFVITRVIPPCNYVIQRSKKSKPQVVHQDKLKIYHAPNPANWKKSDQEQKSTADVEEGQRNASQEDQPSGNQGGADIFDVEVDLQRPPEKRHRKPSVRFKDYEVGGPRSSSSTPTRSLDGNTEWTQNDPYNAPGQQLPAASFTFSGTPNLQSHGPTPRQTFRPTPPLGRGQRGPVQASSQQQQKRTGAPPMRFLDYVM